MMRSFVGLFLAAVTSAVDPSIVGYYSWNWGPGSTGPPFSNAGVAFTGLTDLNTAISGYTPGAAWCCPQLKGLHYLTLGGGNSAGVFTVPSLQAIAANVSHIVNAGYKGVMFDVEEVTGPSSATVPAFAAAFAACKNLNLTVGVTTSHSAPYQCDSPEDAIALVKAWVVDSNIDILSPQLYSSGQESAPEFAETASCVTQGCTWDLYKGAKAVMAPTIVDVSQYAAVETYFQTNYGIATAGFFQWAQTK